MGVVYLVRHHGDDSPFILKTLQQPDDESQRAQFLREAEIWVGLGRHRNIVRARFVKLIDGLRFVAADYIPSRPDRQNSLQAYVGCAGLPPSLLLCWAAQFCYGMAHAQTRGVITHRDIKPANLMLTPDNELCITDFGLARSFTLPSGSIEGAMELRCVSGTLPYMAPEQFRTPDQLDHRVDMYAFGATLYELLAGTPPFIAKDSRELVQRILMRPAEALQHPLWPICERCLRKAPSTRYQTFDELLQDTRAVASRIGTTLPNRPPISSSDENELVYARALSYSEMSRPDLAMQYAIKYCELAPEDDRAWNELGRQRLTCYQPNEAVEALLRSIELAPFNATARNNLGVALHRLGRDEEAVAQLRVAASHDPLNTGALLNQSAPLIELRRPLEAIQVMQEAARIAPEKASIWANLGALHMEVGQETEAEQCLRRALELHPGLQEAKTNLETLRARRSSKSQRANRPDPSALIAAGRFNEAEAMLWKRSLRIRATLMHGTT